MTALIPLNCWKSMIATRAFRGLETASSFDLRTSLTDSDVVLVDRGSFELDGGELLMKGARSSSSEEGGTS